MEADVGAAPAPAGAGELLERGRYAIYQSADGGIVIPRASGICDTCAGCGCGEQQDPIRAPAAVVKMALAAAQGKGGLGRMMGMGRGGK